jgi:hypothetical protein
MGLSVMKKKAEDDGLLRDGRIIKSLKGEQLGSEYNLLSGPSGSTVRVYKAKPEEHELRVPGKGARIMSRESLREYVSNTGKGLTEDMSLTELMRRSNIEKAQQEDVKKIKSNK